jgi:hypothetical protein
VLSKDYKEFIELLNANNVKYLVVGGYAVAVHGYPRYTKDLDVWIERSSKNAENLLRTLDQFGFGSLEISSTDFLDRKNIIQLGFPPNRIDLITSLQGLAFNDCYPKGVDVEIDNVRVKFIDIENLKMNKKATGRPQDLADLDNLENE